MNSLQVIALLVLVLLALLNIDYALILCFLLLFAEVSWMRPQITGLLLLHLLPLLLLGLSNLSSIDGPELLDVEFFHAIYFEVVAAAVERLQPNLRRNASEYAIVDDCDSVAKHVGLLHGMRGQHHCPLAFELRKNVP